MLKQIARFTPLITRQRTPAASFLPIKTSAASLSTEQTSQSPNRRTDGPAFTAIRKKLQDTFPDLTHLEIFNDSYKHAGHQPMESSNVNRTESHMRLEIVSDKFQGMTLPARHRYIYDLLADEMKHYQIHALQLSTRTVEEHRKKEDARTK